MSDITSLREESGGKQCKSKKIRKIRRNISVKTMPANEPLEVKELDRFLAQVACVRHACLRVGVILHFSQI